MGASIITHCVSESEQKPAIVELLEGISDRRIRRKVKKLLDFGAEAVRSLGELDDALYLKEGGEDQMQIVADAVMSHVRRLIEYLTSIASSSASSDSMEIDVDFEFASGDSFEASGKTEVSRSGSVAGTDPGADIEEKSDKDKWAELTTEMDSLQYGLESEIKEFDRRFSLALSQDRQEQALRDLNDATSSIQDGVFAMMTTVYERFLGYADRDRMIPGHRDTLGKALAVRRQLTELRREVQELNRSIQDPNADPAVAEMSFKLLVESVDAFMASNTFAYLRSSDRKDFVAFGEKLREGDPKRNRFDCEGLDKYLDSLAVVSKRDVLIKHDSDLRDSIGGELEGAIALAGTRPQLALELIQQAFVEADKLFGLMDEVDTLVYKWSSLPEERHKHLQTALSMARSLKDLVAPPKVAPPANDRDFF